jgi:hypothetical protein
MDRHHRRAAPCSERVQKLGLTSAKSELVPSARWSWQFHFRHSWWGERSEEYSEVFWSDGGLEGGLMIGGFDTVIICGGDIRESIHRFLQGRSRDWPKMRISISGVSEGEQFEEWTRFRHQLPLKGEILVARDEVMEAAWEGSGYALNREGEGPFAIYYEEVKWTSMPIKALSDPYDRSGFRFEPYQLTLVARGLKLVTLVTPDLESRFSRSLIDSFIAVLERQIAQ